MVEPILREKIDTVFSLQKHKAIDLRGEKVKDRMLRIKLLRGWVKENREAITQAVYNDFRKPALETELTETLYILDEISHALGHLPQWMALQKIDSSLIMAGTRSWFKYEPKGTTLIISPWNYPFSLNVGPLVSSLAAGNTAMVKPSEHAPHTAALIKKMAHGLFEEDTVAAFTGGPEVAQYLSALPFDHIYFTGSGHIGKLVMKAASENHSSLTLELSGKSPALVTASANLKEAARRIAMVKFVNTGQTCVAPDYVLVDKSIEKPFIDEIVRQVQLLFLKNGDSFKTSSSYARIIDERHFVRLVNMLKEVTDKGHLLAYGGDYDMSERYIQPTILSLPHLDFQLMKEEIFGPVLPILTFATFDQALQTVNAFPKPLGVYLFSKSKKEQERVLLETSSGAVCYNDSGLQFLHHNLPFGGNQASGLGRAHGYAGFQAFSNGKAVLKQRHGLTSFSPFYPPYNGVKQKMLDVLMRLF